MAELLASKDYVEILCPHELCIWTQSYPNKEKAGEALLAHMKLAHQKDTWDKATIRLYKDGVFTQAGSCSSAKEKEPIIEPVLPELSTLNILPDSRLKTPKKIIQFRGLNWIPIFCANCGADGGLVPEENMTFAFYLCQPCADKHGDIEGTYVEPDAVFWEKVRNEQIEKYGRELNPAEMVEVLKDDNHPLTKLSKDRNDFLKKSK